VKPAQNVMPKKKTQANNTSVKLKPLGTVAAKTNMLRQ